MSVSLPPEISLTERPSGAHYRLPPRQHVPYRYVALASLLVGLILCATPIIPVWKVVQALRQQLPAEEGLLWLGAFVFLFMFFRGGLYLVQVALFTLAGHSEIELRDGTLRAVERCGWLCWTWERSTTDLRRLFISNGMGPLKLWGKIDGLCVITPEWKPGVDGASPRPMGLAPGYPRSWLLELAGDLARRCLSSEPGPAAGPPPVLEKEPDQSDYEELAEQPTGSKVVVERTAKGLTLTVPPLVFWQRTGYLFVALFVCFVAFGFTTNIGANKDGAITVVAALVAWGAGISLLVIGLRHAAPGQVVFALNDNSLIIRQASLFGPSEVHWRRNQVADVFVMHYPGDSETADQWELRICLLSGLEHRLLAHHHVHDLRWLATLLRYSLGCPGHTPISPPAGLVVQTASPLQRLES